MRTIKWHCNTGFAGCKHEGEFEVDDDATDEEIELMVQDQVFNEIDWGWEENENI